MTEELKQAAQQATKHATVLSDGEVRHYAMCCVTTEDAIRAAEQKVLERALTAAQSAQTERDAFEAWTETQPHGKYPLRRDQEGQYWADGTEVAWDAWQARASLPTQPAAQATPEPVGEPIKWWNGCDKSVPDALRFLANNPRPAGGSDRYNAEHLFQLAGEIERMARQPLSTHPAPGVPDVEDLRDRLVAISAAVADSDDRAAQAMLGEILRALAAAQAKGVGA